MRTCIFCGERAGSREHLWPQWVLDKVAPGRVRGFIGRHKGLEFGREITVRRVCGRCNNGWMSDIETANMHTLGSMIDDNSVVLGQEQRKAIAAWSLKTAMIMDSLTMADVAVFYTERERRLFMESGEIPSATSVWLGRYLGKNDIAAHWSRVNFRYRNEIGPTRVATFIVGSVAVQVMTMHCDYRRVIVVTPKQGAWDHLLVEAWPSEDSLGLHWPPVLAFDDSETIVDISTLPDRWHVGQELPVF